MIKHIKNHIINRAEIKPIILDAFYSTRSKNQPVIIFCHGYKGFKDWGAWNTMCSYIAERGACIIKFNFSFNGGTVENPVDFPDLEAFGNNNYTKELNDLNDVITWAQSCFLDNNLIDTNNINLIGHSRGGGIVLLKAKEDKRVKSVVTLAGVSDFEIRFGNPEEILAWKEQGVKYIVNGRTKQKMPHYFQFYEDFLGNKNRLNIKRAVQGLEIPHLIIHGDKDTSVKVEEAYNLHKWNPNSALEIINNADHVFNTKHPWNQDALSDELEEAVKLVLNFIL